MPPLRLPTSSVGNCIRASAIYRVNGASYSREIQGITWFFSRHLPLTRGDREYSPTQQMLSKPAVVLAFVRASSFESLRDRLRSRRIPHARYLLGGVIKEGIYPTTPTIHDVLRSKSLLLNIGAWTVSQRTLLKAVPGKSWLLSLKGPGLPVLQPYATGRPGLFWRAFVCSAHR